MIALVAGLLIAVGILIALISGLCGLILTQASGGGAPAADPLWTAVMAWSPFVLGVAIVIAGVLLLRSARKRRKAPKDGDDA